MTPHPRRIHGLLCVLLLGATASRAAAQSLPSGVGSAGPAGISEAVSSPPVSIERIRRALELRDRAKLRTDLPPLDRRGTIALTRGLDLVVGIDPLSNLHDAVPYGAPTHREFMQAMTPKWFTEGRPSDALGVTTATAIGLLPAAIERIAGWFKREQSPAAPAAP